jgi:prevent-host-death family protein
MTAVRAREIRPSKDLRTHYRQIADIAKKNPVIITNRGKGDTVLISMEDYARFEDYTHQQYILDALDEAEKRAADPNAKWYSFEEVKTEFLNRKRT